MSPKKKLVFIIISIVALLLISLVTVIALKKFDSGNKGLQSSSSREAKDSPGNEEEVMTGSPSELRQKAINAAEAGEKNKALRYFEAAKVGFQQINDTMAVEEIDTQIDQAKSIPDKADYNDVVTPDSEKSNPDYVSR